MSEKRLRIQDRILLGLALAGDLYFEIFEPYSLQISKLKGFLPSNYKASNFYAGARRLLQTGLIEKVLRGGELYLRLTSAGKNFFRREISLSTLRRKGWDRRWRLVFYDIAEIERKSRRILRNKLLEIGFGQMQKSIYVSPYPLADDVREFLIASGLDQKVFVAVVQRLLAGEERELAKTVWRLDKLSEQYQKLVEQFEKAKPEERNEKRFCQKLRASFLEIYQSDPLLPQELLPEDWMGEKAKALIRKLSKN